MGSSAKAPKQSSSQKKAEQLQIETLERQKKEAERPVVTPEIKLPKPTPPPPPPAPPQQSIDGQNAEEDARRKAARRVNSGRNTLFAGETGGYKGAAGAKTTLLG